MQEPYLIDTHTHIYYHAGTNLLNEQINRCHEHNINKLLLPNVDIESIPLILESIEKYPETCFPMMGLHPCSVKDDYIKQLSQIERQITQLSLCAIGEIGIDLYWDSNFIDAQKDAFRTQIKWAMDLGLPIAIHCREAFDIVVELLEEVGDSRLFGVFHCFTGSYEEAQKAIDLGFILGIGGVVTFKNSGLDKVVAKLDLKNIVLETDAPYLAPSPFRGKTNESSYLRFIAEKVADLHHISVEQLATITTQNAHRVFNIKEFNV